MAPSEPARVLIVDDQVAVGHAIAAMLEPEGHEVRTVTSGEEALTLVMRQRFDVVLLDIAMPGLDGAEVLRRLGDVELRPEVIVMTGKPGVDSAVEAMKLGAHDYLAKPVDRLHLTATVGNAIRAGRLEEENQQLRQIVHQHQSSGPVVRDSPKMAAVINMAERIARGVTTVLIQGETGTGKGLLAKRVHAKSARANRNFVHVNCGALQETLFESELFGHEKGAFTGAVSAKPGLFEVANGGTLFLDEVGELGLTMQSKLLQVLDNESIRRVGGTSTRSVDARLIAATNKDLQTEVAADRFREDLFFRLNVAPLRVPPLRDRVEDIDRLVGHYLNWYRVPGEKPKQIRPAALEALKSYSWPGNVRELSNTMQILNLLVDGPVIRLEHLPQNVRARDALAASRTGSLTALRDVERRHILEILEQTDGNRAAAARLLGITAKTLRAKLRRYETEQP